MRASWWQKQDRNHCPLLSWHLTAVDVPPVMPFFTSIFAFSPFNVRLVTKHLSAMPPLAAAPAEAYLSLEKRGVCAAGDPAGFGGARGEGMGP